HDCQAHGGGVAQRNAVAGPVGEAVRPQVSRVGCVVERAVGVQDGGAVTGAGGEDDGEGIPVGVLVVAEERTRGEVQRPVVDGGQGVVVGHGRRVGDGDGHGGRGAEGDAVAGLVGEGVVAGELRVGQVVKGAVGVEGQRAVGRAAHQGGGRGVAVGV